MGLGILEDHKLENVPGTVVLTLGKEDETDTATLNPLLKYDTSGPTPILLVPQPTDDSNDPLNWPIWKRDLIVLVLCFSSILSSTLAPILAADAIIIVFAFETNIAGVAHLTGWHLCGVGVFGFFMVASARIWGKRHLYLLGSFMLVVSSVWAAYAKSYKSFAWARIIQGAAVAPFESLVSASVGDLYCVHQRGVRMAIANLSLFGGAFFTPVIVGITSINLNWQWTFKLLAIFGAVAFPAVVFFCPETAYRRPKHLDLDMCITDEFRLSRISALYKPENSVPESSTNATALPPKATFIQTLAPFNGRKTDDSYLKLVLRPIFLLFYPVIIWAMLTQGTLIGWTVTIGVEIAELFTFKPLYFTPAQVGYSYSGPFIGALLGFLLSGLLADYSAKILTRWNKGIYEPEFRLVLVIPQVITGVLGLFGFGFTASNLEKYGWLPSIIFFALEVMGMTIGAVASALYIVDAYRNIAIESFTCMLLFKNFFSFGITWIAVDWLQSWGPWKMFMSAALIQLGVGLLTVPLYVLGKRNRSLMSRNDPLKYLDPRVEAFERYVIHKLCHPQS